MLKKRWTKVYKIVKKIVLQMLVKIQTSKSWYNEKVGNIAEPGQNKYNAWEGFFNSQMISEVYNSE